MRIKKLKSGFEELTKEKSRIIAHSIGDGCVYKNKHDYIIKYEVIDKELLDSFEKDMLKVYGLSLTKGSNPSGKTGKLIPYVKLRSKLVYEDLLKYSTYFSKDWKIYSKILTSSKEIKREFLKSFFDDEGSIFEINNRPILRLYSINLEGLKQIQNMLLEFDIKVKEQAGYGLKRNVYALVIKDLELFYKEIGFNLERKQKKLRELIESNQIK